MNADRLLAHYDQIADAPDSIDRLRRFVLDLAVRGKLVPQDPKDEPASALFKRIAKEKDRLVEAGRIKEAKPLSLADVTGSRQGLPEIWKWVPFGDVINSHLGGGTPSKGNSTYWDGEIPWASVKDVGKTKYLDDTIDHITKEGLAGSSSNLVPKGSLIVVTRMGLGKVSINRRELAINQDLRALSLSSLMDIDYCYLFLKTHGFEGAGMTVKGIKVEELLSVSFPLPPLAEQHRIVAKVDELMTLCDRLELARAELETTHNRLTASSLARLNAPDPETFQDDALFVLNSLQALTTRPDQIRQMRQTILNLAVRGNLVPQDPKDESAAELLKRIALEKARLVKAGETRKEKPLPNLQDPERPFQIPSSWVWVRLETLAQKITDGEHLSPNKTTSGMPLLTAVHVSAKAQTLENPQFVSVEDGLKSRLRCDPRRGDILICSRGTIGRCAVVDTDEIFCLMGSVILVRLPSECSESYFNAFLSTDRAQQQMRGMSGATAVQALYLKDIRLCPLPLPPLAEQHRIVAKVEELMALCDQLEASLTDTAATRRRLLDALLVEALAPAA